jgi:pimeloyl-ACP methyl ester carboxylesterase
VAIGGFSQGGHAALWAAQLAPHYAPELRLIGLIVAAPVADPTAFTDRADSPQQVGVVVTVAYGMSQAYPDLHLADVLTHRGMSKVPLLEKECIGDVVAAFDEPVREVIRRFPTTTPAWRARLGQNLAGQVALGLPVRVIQGARDPIVSPAVSRALVDRLCRSGDTVQEVLRGADDHAVVHAPDFVGWLHDRLVGRPAPSTCDAAPLAE